MNAETFWASMTQPDDGCWVWQRARHSNATHQYGMAYWSEDKKVWRAHRLAWTLVNGPIPAGMFLLHTCDNPPCCRPDHLRLGTQHDNMQDKAAKKRGRASHRGPEIAEIIRRLYSTGKLSQYELATAFDLSRSHIANIVNGRRWR